MPYLQIASICTNALATCAAGWLHRVVLWCVWNAMKFTIMGLVCLILLVCAQNKEALAQRRVPVAQRTGCFSEPSRAES